MADQFLAEIRIFPFNFAPNGWAFCNGQLISISQNTALFSILGTVYGGDGKSNFALPNLQGRAPMHPGQGPGLSRHDLGKADGSETVTLLESEIPAHSHAMRCATQDNADVKQITNTASFAPATGGTPYQPSPDTSLAPQALVPAGGDAPHNNLMPYLTFNYCIALQGIYPSRP
ncbi:MAG: Microcystin dependent protein [uncultured Rubrobacteraceae bacterium]|uniref:Microcystin dependent protein n=1 Tax=uncultured Rubrobacteraceae bacterium TaxID=349277 RepID=A0A6J4SN05_9ACTN|nr:MAG: Microcystin dependent protein [uncultured Rubrobacteraceae bacterium]